MKKIAILTLLLLLTGCSHIQREATCKCFNASGEATGKCNFIPLELGPYVAEK